MTLLELLQPILFGSTLLYLGLLSGPTRDHRRVGFAVACLSQIPWFAMGVVTDQWSVWALAIICGCLHFRGFRNNL